MLDLDAFGQMLRQARERLDLRPIDLALAMNWSGTAPVYRYERGGPNAPRADPDTVNAFAQVLGLDYADRITLLGFAGHVPDTEPLAPHEEARLVDMARPALEYVQHGALLFDYRWRILALNVAYRAFLGIDEAVVAAWRKREVTTLDLTWDASFGVRSGIADFEATAQLQLLRFKLYNRLRRHEAWYRAYPACRAYYSGFVELWEDTDRVLASPDAALDLQGVMSTPAVRRLPNGELLRYESSQRNIHGAYGMIGMLVMTPLDDMPDAANTRPREAS